MRISVQQITFDVIGNFPSFFLGLVEKVRSAGNVRDKSFSFLAASLWLVESFFNPQGFLTAVQQEITRAHKAENWALDSVVMHAEVTEIPTFERVHSAPREGVYCHGLFMDGAAYSLSEGSVVESEPKKLFSAMPILLVLAVTKTAKRQIANSANYGPFKAYECPVYKYPVRSDKYYIFSVLLATQSHKPVHWILRGVGLLCTCD